LISNPALSLILVLKARGPSHLVKARVAIGGKVSLPLNRDLGLTQAKLLRCAVYSNCSGKSGCSLDTYISRFFWDSPQRQPCSHVLLGFVCLLHFADVILHSLVSELSKIFISGQNLGIKSSRKVSILKISLV